MTKPFFVGLFLNHLITGDAHFSFCPNIGFLDELPSAIQFRKTLLKKKKKPHSLFLFIWLHWVLVAAYKIFSCGMWGLIPWPGIEPRCPVLGAWSVSHWTTREVPPPAKRLLCSLSSPGAYWPYLENKHKGPACGCWNRSVDQELQACLGV